jgi:ADP-ribose pyrophosphatase
MKKIEEKVLYEGQWLAVHETIYQTRRGLLLKWETVHRRRSAVGVVVVAKLMPSGRFILIKQYRPAIDGYIIAFPAGLGANDPAHALVELKEETGYTGVIKDISPVLKTGSSMINDNARIVYVEVDEKAAVNQEPAQDLEDAEDIEVCLVAKTDVKNFLLKQIEQGNRVAANLWYVFGIDQWIK